MATYYVKKDENYVVSATVDCNVYDSNDKIFLSCKAKESVIFKAPTSKIVIGDDNAALRRALDVSEGSGGSGGSVDSGELTEHINNAGVHVTPQEKAAWNGTANSLVLHSKDESAHIPTEHSEFFQALLEHGDLVWDINKLFPGEGTPNPVEGMPELWYERYCIQRLRKYFYDIDAANNDTDPETGLTYSKKFMVAGMKLRYYRHGTGANGNPSPFWCTATWNGGNIDWNWKWETDGDTKEFDDFTYSGNWLNDIPNHSFEELLNTVNGMKRMPDYANQITIKNITQQQESNATINLDFEYTAESDMLAELTVILGNGSFEMSNSVSIAATTVYINGAVKQGLAMDVYPHSMGSRSIYLKSGDTLKVTLLATYGNATCSLRCYGYPLI